MPWVKLTDDWYDDSDLIEAGPLAMLAWPVLISWSVRNLQDGKIPAGQVRRLVDWSALGVDPEQAIAPLVACGRLQVVDGGYLITNFLKYQPSREKVLADRDKDRKRKSTGGSNPPPPVQMESAQNPDVPVPVPHTTPPPSSTSDLVPEAVWTEVGKKQLAAAKGINHPPKYVATVIANAKAACTEDTVWIWDTYDITPAQLAGIIVSGNRQGLSTLSKRKVSA